MVGLYQLNTDRLCQSQSASNIEEEYQWSVFLCCLDVSYCMRCLIYWDKFEGAALGEEGGYRRADSREVRGGKRRQQEEGIKEEEEVQQEGAERM